MIDFLKLGRLEEKGAQDVEAARALFDRYRLRSEKARNLCRQAVRGAAPEFQSMGLAQLALYSNDELTAVQVDMAALNLARRETQLAQELQREFERRREATRPASELLVKLRRYAGTTGDE